MSHSYAQNFVHIVFSTKDRHRSLSKALQQDMWAYLAGICKNLDLHVAAIGGHDDHVHLLVRIPATMTVAKAILTIKTNSSKWAGERAHDFAWQKGYAAFSVSASLAPAVARYIRTQESHHKKMTFEEEFVALLKKHGVDFDPAFVFG